MKYLFLFCFVIMGTGTSVFAVQSNEYDQSPEDYDNEKQYGIRCANRKTTSLVACPGLGEDACGDDAYRKRVCRKLQGNFKYIDIEESK